MTVARENTAPSPGASLTPLAARLELLLRRAITVDQFEADMVSCCEAHPDEVWNLLALLDQYHRLEKLPTELYRALKAATERYGLVRREPYIPSVTTKARPTPEPTVDSASVPSRDATTAASPVPPEPSAVSAPTPPPASRTVPPAPSPAPMAPPPAATSLPQPVLPQPVLSKPVLPRPVQARPAAAADSWPAPPDAAKAPDAAAGNTPFRHLLDDDDDEPVIASPAALGQFRATRQDGRNVLPTRPPRRSKAGAWLLPALLVAIVLGAAAWLKQGQGSVDMLAGPDDAAQRAANAAAVPTPSTAPQPEAAPTPAPQPEAVPAPSFSSEPAPTSAAARSPTKAAAPAHVPVPAGPPPAPAASAAPPAAVLAVPPASPAATPPAIAPQAVAPAAPAMRARPAPDSADRAAAVTAAPATGPSTVEFAADSYTVRPGDSAARILVRRSGNVNGDLNFVWWTENATAVADVDYVAWGHRSEKIASGRNSVTLLVPIINDSTRTTPRRFQVVIGSADSSARLGATTHATVQLSGSG